MTQKANTDCPECGAPAGYPAAGPCATHTAGSVVERAREAAKPKLFEPESTTATALNAVAFEAADAAMRLLLTELRDTAQSQDGRTEAYEAVMDQIDGALTELRP